MTEIMGRTSLRLVLFTFASCAGAVSLVGCSQKQVAEQQTPSAPAAPASPSSNPIEAPLPSAATKLVDATVPEATYAGSMVFQAPILSDMAWPSSDARRDRERDKERVVILGYIRRGQKAAIIPEPHKKSNCTEGWYELLAGGFICGKYITLDLNHPRFKLAKGPDLASPLPYTYGINTQHGTPLYRQVPSREERVRAEPWLTKPKKPKIVDEESPSVADAGTLDSTNSLFANANATGAAESAEPEKPWYLREHDGGAPVQIKLDELREEGGVVARRMVRGFYLSLDRQFGIWWKTNEGLVAPADRIWIAKPLTEFHGAWLSDDINGGFTGPDGGAPIRIDALPIGFVLSRSAKKYRVNEDRKKVQPFESVPRFSTVHLTGESATIGGIVYNETDQGWWMKAVDGTKTDPGPPPPNLAPNEKWIDVNLRRQTLVAFEGEKPVFVTLVSSGREEHETPPGTFRIREKHIASTMDGDAEAASDGPYSIQDVPYIQYFNGGYALHGAFWHAEFGRVKSHGCVNLAPLDAKALFSWTDPPLPDGWHGVVSTSNKPGTRVVVH